MGWVVIVLASRLVPGLDGHARGFVRHDFVFAAHLALLLVLSEHLGLVGQADLCFLGHLVGGRAAVVMGALADRAGWEGPPSGPAAWALAAARGTEAAMAARAVAQIGSFTLSGWLRAATRATAATIAALPHGPRTF